MNIFGKKEEQEQKPTQSVEPEAAKIISDITSQAKENARLRHQAHQDSILIEDQRREIEFLRGQLADAEYKRDYYQRHSTTLLTRLSDINMVIRNALDEARREAQHYAETHTGDGEALPKEAVEKVEEALSEDNITIQKEIDKL
jgi:hypothetical protein